MDSLLPLLGDEVEDASEETFALFSQPQASQDLGMLDPKAPSLDLTVAGRDFTLTQSPGLLHSNRQAGTTGAAVWQTSVRFAEWLSSPSNSLFGHCIIGPESTVLELGAGVSALNACLLAPRVSRVIATDQPYALKILRENIAANRPVPKKSQRNAQPIGNVQVLALDWETDAISSFLATNDLAAGVDVVMASDCIYNYALIEPFVQACAEICQARLPAEVGELSPTVCVVAQHLRQPDVFEQWAEVFMRSFRTWRVPTELLNEGFGEGSGFAMHIGVLR